MSRFLFLIAALVGSILCMQATQPAKGEVIVLTRPNHITDQFTALASDDTSIRSFVDAVAFEKMQGIDILFLKAPETPVDPSVEGLSLSVHVTRNIAKSLVLESYDKLVKIGSESKVSKLIAGFQLSCQSESSPNCLFTLLLRTKTLSASVARKITSTFAVIGSKGQTQKKSFFDNMSQMLWSSNNSIIDNGQRCSWRFVTGAFSVCFDEHSLASVMELIRCDSISSFSFKHCSNRSVEKKLELKVSVDAKNKLPVLLTSLSLRSGTSLGFSLMSSFGFGCDGDECLLKIAYDGELNVRGLLNLLEMDNIVTQSMCVPFTDESAWVFYRRSNMLLASIFFDKSNASHFKRILNDSTITLWKTKIVYENSKTLTSLRGLGDPYYTVSFEVPKIDTKLVTLMHVINNELLISTSCGCSFLRRLIHICINRQSETGIIGFSFSKATEMKDLKVAVRFLELLCKIVDEEVVGPNVFKNSENSLVTKLNFDELIIERKEADIPHIQQDQLRKAKEAKRLCGEETEVLRERELEELRIKEAEEVRKREETLKLAAETKRQEKLEAEALIKKQKAEEARKEQDRQRELKHQQAEARKEEQRKAAEFKKQEQLRKQEEARIAEEIRRAEAAKQEREKAEQRKRDLAKKAEEQRMREAEQRRRQEEIHIAEEKRKAELEKQRKAEEEKKKAELEKQRKAAEDKKKAELEKQRKAAEAEKKAEYEKQRKAEEEAKQAEIERQCKIEETRQLELEQQRKADEAKQLELEQQRKDDEAKQLELEQQRKADEAKQLELEQQRKDDEAKQLELEKQRKAQEHRRRKEAEDRRLQALEDEKLRREEERKAEDLRIAEELRTTLERKKAEAESKAMAKKQREIARKTEVATQKKRVYKLSEVQEVHREVTPTLRKKYTNMKDRANIITVAQNNAGPAPIMSMVPVPQSSVLMALDMEYWLSNHPEFLKTWNLPSASPFVPLKDEFEFWVHQGEMYEKIIPEKFIRVFKPYQTITCLESLYYNYINAVIDIFAELPGKNHLGLFKKSYSLKIPSARTAIRLSLDAGQEAKALLNLFWQITMMLMIQHDAEWYPHLRGVIVEPSDEKTFKLEAWWDPNISANSTHSFEDAFLAEARKIAQIPDDAAEWEILC